MFEDIMIVLGFLIFTSLIFIALIFVDFFLFNKDIENAAWIVKTLFIGFAILILTLLIFM